MDSQLVSHATRTRLRYLMSSLEKRELENQAHYGVKAVLKELTTFGEATGVLKELLAGALLARYGAVAAAIAAASIMS